ncbi:plant U-box 8 [Artemisia annua]|uniref:RING-type E3 ubiquitin transferase n=1 Tax=Artemisia annua TaxID=35608 RepID=A0A2U1P0K1_ARTAN|nr:plant U-box 8 [Artemisia annua]
MATTTNNYPDDFKCPISLELMSEPVIISSGHTFDRRSIQRWLDAGHRTCPITNLPLSDSPILIPNHALKSLISSYNNLHHQKPISNHQLNPQTLISTLTCQKSTPEVKLMAVEELLGLSKHDFDVRKRLCESGAVKGVLGCVGVRNNQNGVELQEKALKLLLNLSLDDDNKVGLVAEGGLCQIIESLFRGESSDCRATAATVVTSLAVVEVNKATIGAYPFAIKGLVSLLNVGCFRERKEAATALYALCSYPDNRRRAVECGVVSVLVNALSEGLERAVEVLGLLAKCRRGREEMVRFDGFVRVLVNVLREGSSRGVQYALMTLNLICLSSESVCAEALREGVFELCLRFLEDDSEKVRRNASSLIKVFGGAGSVRANGRSV